MDEVRNFVKTKMLKQSWQYCEKYIPCIGSSCLLFKKKNLIILIEIGYIDVECTDERAHKIRIYQRKRIKIKSKRNAKIYEFKYKLPNVILYYGYATNETIPHINGVFKWH